MNFVQVALLILLVIAVLCGAAILVHSLTRFRERTLDDVRTVLQPVDILLLEEMLDAQGELDLTMLRGDNLAYRREMRARLDAVREHMRRGAHNALIILQWGGTEHEDMKRWIESYSNDQRTRITNGYNEARIFRRLALLHVAASSILCLWRFDKWRLLPVPPIASLRQIAGIDFIEAYKRLVDATAELGMIYGAAEADELRSRMGACCASTSPCQ